MWYTVSKSCREIAKDCILSSNHVKMQWNNRAIFRKAVHQMAPEILTIFLDAKWEFNSSIINILRGCPGSRDMILKILLRYDYVREIIRKDERILDCFSYSPEETVKYFPDVLDMTFHIVEEYGFTNIQIRAYDRLFELRRFDLIDKWYTRDQLSEEIRISMKIIDYTSGITSTVPAITIDRETYRKIFPRITNDTLFRENEVFRSRFIEICEVITGKPLPELILFCSISSQYIQGVEEYLSRDIPINDRCEHVAIALMRLKTARVNDNITLRRIQARLRDYLMSQTDYSKATANIWICISHADVDLFIHILKCGYRVKPPPVVTMAIHDYECIELENLIRQL